MADGAREQQGVSARDCAAVISLQEAKRLQICRAARLEGERGPLAHKLRLRAESECLSSQGSCRYYAFKVFQLNEPGPPDCLG